MTESRNPSSIRHNKTSSPFHSQIQKSDCNAAVSRNHLTRNRFRFDAVHAVKGTQEHWGLIVSTRSLLQPALPVRFIIRP